uniref:Ig-like domain-containing protein n=1 Tax=Malurus cyaneus samueli TaxID=2593467 RepID=A0A8C5TRK4_9PASS
MPEPKQAPVFDIKPESIDVPFGESADFECHVTGAQPIHITWSKDGQEIRTGRNYNITFTDNTAHLRVLRVGKGDSGQYTCQATGSDECSTYLSVRGQKISFLLCCVFLITVIFKRSSNVLLCVLFVCLEPPSFVKKPEPLDVLSGENITFTSIVKGSPPLEVKWFRGSVELVPGPRCNITLQDSVAELELFDVQPLESGDYTCQVSNEAGKSSCTTHLFVKGLSRLLLLMLLKMISWLDVHETLTPVIGLNSTPTKRKEEEDQPIDILELLKNVDPKEYEKYARMYGITDFRGLLQAFELLKQTQAEESHRLVR